MAKAISVHRNRNIFNPGSPGPFKLSRSKIELYMRCPRCFYLDRRLGIAQPPGFPFNLNSAVDKLLKKEFDVHRAKGSRHPLVEHYGVDAVPFEHFMMDEWRENFKGVRFLHTPTNLLVTGAVDDLWVNPAGELIVVDYKATAKDGEVSIDADWQIAYKRQMEVYQWLFRQNGYNVSSTGYFVYCNGITDTKAFDARLEFRIKLIPYTGDDAWVENALQHIWKCLNGDHLPEAALDCEFCDYRARAQQVE